DNAINRTLAIKTLTTPTLSTTSDSALCITESRNGLEAYTLHLENPYDIILMDIDMPIMNGDEATRLIRKHECDNLRGTGGVRVPIIAITSSCSDEQVFRYFQCGVQAVLAKPYLKKDLVDVVARYL
ncbi:hypothetical protein HDU76_008321, partial [Blyttiomyces sp. JEL0837]